MTHNWLFVSRAPMAHSMQPAEYHWCHNCGVLRVSVENLAHYVVVGAGHQREEPSCDSAECGRLRAERDKWIQNFDSCHDDLGRLRAEVGHLRGSLKAAQIEIEQRTTNLRELGDRVERIRSAEEENARLRETVDGLTARIHGLAKQCGQDARERDALRLDLARVTEERDTAEAQCRRLRAAPTGDGSIPTGGGTRHAGPEVKP